MRPSHRWIRRLAWGLAALGLLLLLAWALRPAPVAVSVARAERRFTEAEFERYQTLHQCNLVSGTDLDQRRSQLDRQRAVERSAASSIEAARFEVESARAVLAMDSGQRGDIEHPELEVRSPIEGTVLNRYRCCEGSVAAGEPILELGSLDTLEVQVDLLSMDAVRIRPDMPVRLTGWGGEAPLAGRVRRIEPAGFTRVSALGVDEQRVPVIVDFSAQSAPAELGLGSGFRVDAEFLIWQADEVLQLPTSALFRADGQWSVFRVEEERARRVAVTPGRRSGLVTQVLAGVEAGDRVIVHPGERVEDGIRVAVAP